MRTNAVWAGKKCWPNVNLWDLHRTCDHTKEENKIDKCKMASGIKGVIETLVLALITMIVVSLLLNEKSTSSFETSHGLLDNMEEVQRWPTGNGETLGYKILRSLVRKQKCNSEQILEEKCLLCHTALLWRYWSESRTYASYQPILSNNLKYTNWHVTNIKQGKQCVATTTTTTEIMQKKNDVTGIHLGQ